MKKRHATLVRQVCAVASAAVLVVALHTVAASDDEPVVTDATVFKGRPYIALGGGISTLTPGDRCPCIAIGDENDTGVSVAIGYDFSTWITTEIYFADLGAASVDFLGSEVADVTYETFGASVIGYLYNSQSGFSFGSKAKGLARREGLSLYGRVGVGSMQARTAPNIDHNRDHITHVAFGAGLEYGFRNGFAVRGEFMSYDTDAQLAQVVVLKRFGKASAPPVSRSITPGTNNNTDAITPVDKLAGLAVPTVYFDFDKDVVRPDGARDLDELLRELDGTDVVMQLDGHTDYYGTEVYNEGLALRRANSVRRYLISAGVEPGRIRVDGFGETSPATTDRSDAGRALNRRVEITLSRP